MSGDTGTTGATGLSGTTGLLSLFPPPEIALCLLKRVRKVARAQMSSMPQEERELQAPQD